MKTVKYIVRGGELIRTDSDEFRDPSQCAEYGPFDTFEAAKNEWKARSWSTVDNALMRWFILPKEH